MCLFVGGATPMLAGQRRECRRQQISRHFGEAIPECRGGCDVCAEARSRDRPRRPQTRAKVGTQLGEFYGSWIFMVDTSIVYSSIVAGVYYTPT